MYNYFVYVINDFNEQMTYRFTELHDALTLYGVAKHDLTVTNITVDIVEFDENNPESFYNGQTIRVYERV